MAPMLWRFGVVKAGVRYDAARRHVRGRPGRAPAAADAVRRYLRWYGPGTPGDFAGWAGVARPHAERLWQQVEEELVERGRGRILRADAAVLASPPQAEGIRLIPPGDPYLFAANRPLLAPDAALRKRLFRPVASPGVVLRDGRLAGLWRVKAKGKAAEVSVEGLGRLARADLEPEAERIAALRGAAEAVLVVA